MTHKTGFLLQYLGGLTATGEPIPPFESWHRSFKGACGARDQKKGRGKIFRLMGSDYSELVPS